MTTYERDATTLELPWPFAGREDELELVRRSLAGGRRGIVVTGPVGCGKTRLVTEALRGTDCARAAGTPESRAIPFAAFAHLLPEPVTLHRAVQLLSGVRTLVVDDAHLLDDASAALVHQLAVHGRTRLLVVATDGSPVPGAIARLWTGELLPRLALERLPDEETAQLLAAAGAGPLEPLTVNRLRRLSRGDLRLLRDLLGAVRGQLTVVPGTGERAWRGPVPLTTAVRERTAHVLGRTCPLERETLDRLAFAEPLSRTLDDLDLDIGALEVLESDGLIEVDDLGGVRLAHPLHGPVLRAAAGRLRARRLARTPDAYASALDAESAALARRIDQDDVRAMPTPVGEWLVAEGGPLPGRYAALRARFARLRGELREAEAWAREGLRGDSGDASCRDELARARTPVDSRGDLDLEALTDPYDAVRLGAPEKVIDRLTGVFARHADALTRADGPALVEVAEELERRGFTLFAAEAHAQAVRAHRDPSAARHSRTRAVALARRCQGARTPALSGLVLGELTVRQRQVVTLAAAGLSNRQIAERLTLSIRTVGNHLYSAYARLGASDRGALPLLTEVPQAQPA
ncbi:helix-turn-helix transcriptional regulator [Streptomyces coeruleorubidus]|uniref:Helix-turn-helix transcriptional regulator n=1 Tax=Streptomyces coeruleorubidus TaxID=116188 RepID=A0A5J6IL38_STRC4|nr:LuxR C-terminal-related transcriptional regulator [Streptomyces coeruleorubidus]QEV29265.1 helix-turn-helix transcriptional regulator [Streptomyces coeruleorubidus]GGT74093.1 helix-turn-helix transcriptional regulator [Streptomyces coeruleorubidus]